MRSEPWLMHQGSAATRPDFCICLCFWSVFVYFRPGSLYSGRYKLSASDIRELSHPGLVALSSQSITTTTCRLIHWPDASPPLLGCLPRAHLLHGARI